MLLFLLTVFLLASCDVLNFTERGKEGNACYLDNTCKEPYECVEGKCVMPSTDDDAIGESDDEMAVGDDEGTDDQTDLSDETVTDDATIESDDTLETADDAIIEPDEDVADDQSDPTDSSDQSDVDDSVIPTDDAVDVTPTDDAVIVIDDDLVSDDDVVATMAVLCTGQTKCYDATAEMTCPAEGNAFYGQDAQYATLGDYCTPRGYTVSGTAGNDVVTDNVTGLIWQRTLPTTYSGCTGGSPTGAKCTWQQAIDYCGALTYGGYTDWRLPSRKELATLPDYGRYSPAIDATIFSGPQTDSYWSSSSLAYSAGAAWHVKANDGNVHGYDKSNIYYARCVRGESLLDSAFTETTVAGKVIVTDTVTGFQWTKEYASSLNWQSALSYCENLTYGGYTDWRLPNINELKTLIYDTSSSPASTFPQMASNSFWSSSSSTGSTQYAWYVDFNNGYVTIINFNKTDTYYARCVRQ